MSAYKSIDIYEADKHTALLRSAKHTMLVQVDVIENVHTIETECATEELLTQVIQDMAVLNLSKHELMADSYVVEAVSAAGLYNLTVTVLMHPEYTSRSRWGPMLSVLDPEALEASYVVRRMGDDSYVETLTLESVVDGNNNPVAMDAFLSEMASVETHEIDLTSRPGYATVALGDGFGKTFYATGRVMPEL